MNSIDVNYSLGICICLSINLAFYEVQDIFHVYRGTLLCERKGSKENIFFNTSHSLNTYLLSACYVGRAVNIWINAICLPGRVHVEDRSIGPGL